MDSLKSLLMEEKRTPTTGELLSAGRWTQFLESLSFGITDWVVGSYKEIMNLRVTATGLNKKSEEKRKYSIKTAKDNELKIYISVERKKEQV